MGCCEDLAPGIRRCHADVSHSGDLRRDDGHQQGRNQGMPAAGNVTSDRVERPQQLPCRNSFPGAGPGARKLPVAEPPDAGRGQAQRRPQLWAAHRPGRFQLCGGDAQLLIGLQPVPSFGIGAQRAIAFAANLGDDFSHCGFEKGKLRASRFQFPDFTFGRSTPENSHYITTLFRGYSTMPWACACFSRGITCQAAASSMTVFTASQSLLLNVEMVGFCRAGRTASTASRFSLRTFSIKPTRSWASMAPRSIRARFSILRRRPGSAQACWLAMIWVFDSSTVSRIRRRLARSEDPVSVTSTMASASIGGFTSVAPQENSTRT